MILLSPICFQSTDVTAIAWPVSVATLQHRRCEGDARCGVEGTVINADIVQSSYSSHVSVFHTLEVWSSEHVTVM